MNILLIVDPQNDFITGSLAIEGAIPAMDYLTAYVKEHHAEYDAIVVTMDQHPADHCSFDVSGGPWPILIALPICILFFFLQKNFVSGLTSGGDKG